MNLILEWWRLRYQNANFGIILKLTPITSFKSLSNWCSMTKSVWISSDNAAMSKVIPAWHIKLMIMYHDFIMHFGIDFSHLQCQISNILAWVLISILTYVIHIFLIIMARFWISFVHLYTLIILKFKFNFFKIQSLIWIVKIGSDGDTWFTFIWFVYTFHMFNFLLPSIMLLIIDLRVGWGSN